MSAISPIISAEPRSFANSALDRAYWKSKLAGANTRIDLLADRASQERAECSWESVSVRLEPEIARWVRKVSKRSPLASYILTLAAVKILLWRYTGQPDLLVDSPRQLGTPGGDLVPLRTSIDAGKTVRETLEAVRQTVIEAYHHHDLDTTAVAGRANVIVLSPEVHEPFEPGDSEEFVFSFRLQVEEFTVEISYRPSLFSSERAARFANHLGRVMSWMSTSSAEKLEDFRMVSVAEAECLLSWSRGARKEYPIHKSIDQLFHERALKTPDRICAVHGAIQRTYGELDEVSARLAGFLKNSVQVNSGFVGILNNRGIQFLEATMGVLKAGAGYLPIDPDYPQERIRYMLENSGIKVLIAGAQHLEKLGDGEIGDLEAVILLDDSPQRPLSGSSNRQVYSRQDFLNHEPIPAPQGKATEPAYMLYTSGSTGSPKGAIVRHNGAVNHIFAEYDLLSLRAETRFLQSAPASSDISVWQMLAPMVTGGATVIVDFHTTCDPKALFDAIKQQRVTFIELVPAVLQELLNHAASLTAEERRLPDLDCGIVCGEAVPVALVDQWFQLYPRVPLTNAYGPTEASDDVAQHLMTGAIDASERSVLIGGPIPNIDVFILSPRLELQPAGVPGEICVAGIGVGAGYWRNEEKTKSSFIQNPFSQGQDDRVLYRTGDVGRWTSEGQIEFLGRLDEQVKIRGFRVELGEIEAAIRSHPQIDNCVVLFKKTPTPELVAYVVAKQAGTLGGMTPSEYLQGKLPGYMQPSAIVFLPELPLSPSGKVDKKALAAIAPDATDETADGQRPHDPVEQMIGNIWQSVLHTENRIGLRQNFFQIGGHSLIAIQVISRVRQYLSVEIPLVALFECPTIESLAARIRRIQMQSAGRSAAPIQRVSRKAEIPLSLAQEGLWVLDQMHPGCVQYNLPVVIEVEGMLDVRILNRCWNALLERHEVLRTTVGMSGTRPVQWVHPFVPCEIPVVDLGGLSSDKVEAEARSLVEENNHRAFDLSEGPLYRLLLVGCRAGRVVLAYTLHHIVSDAWSGALLVRECLELYRAFSEGRTSPLPELAVQFADYAVWQRRELEGERTKRELQFWKAQLEGAPPVLELPLDRPRPLVQTYVGAKTEVFFGRDLSSRLDELCRREGVTMFMAICAALRALLYRYTGQTDIVLGSVIANRDHPELENVIGFFVNTLALRSDLSGDPNFRELLRQERAVALAAYAHKDVPFEEVVHELRVARGPQHNPVFQVMVVDLQGVADAQVVDPSGLKFRPGAVTHRTAKFDLTLLFTRTGADLRAVLEYRTDLFDADRIQRMGRHLQQMLEVMAASVEQQIGDVELMTQQEREKVLRGWNRLQQEYPSDLCVHELFEQQAKQRPESVALRYEERELTYSELNAQANGWAHRLRALGVGPEDRVGLCVERGTEMVVAIIAIAKAGGVHVPLDPAYPRDRLLFMATDADIKVVLTEEKLSRMWIETGVTVECMGGAVPMANAVDLRLPTSAEQLMYVIYTSGSTGRPKGTLVSHGNVARLFKAAEDGFHFDENDVWTLFHSYGFDFSVWEIWGALIYGGRLVVVPHLVSRSPEVFLQLLAAERVTVLNQTPSAFSQLIAAERDADISLNLRLVIFGGEALSMEMLESWYQRHETDRPRLVNMYGITETTVHVTRRNLGVEDLQGSSVIGWPLPDLRIYLLDARQNLVPIGVVGEIYVGGAGLCRGYMHRPELTAERFVPDAFSGWTGGRLYRSGDLGRYRSDGDLEYLGRRDQQVKIRGYRIELGEIEKALREQEGVREGAVVMRETASSGRELVGYVVLENGVTVKALKRQLKRRLPEHMVPARVMQLDRLPLTANGKVDRRELLSAETEDSHGEERKLPNTATERKLADIWREILKVEHIGVDENFFEVGGHSLSATQLISRTRQLFGVELPLKVLFERPTIAEMAMAIDDSAAGSGASSPDSIQRLERMPAALVDAAVESFSDSEVDLFARKLLEENSKP